MFLVLYTENERKLAEAFQQMLRSEFPERHYAFDDPCGIGGLRAAVVLPETAADDACRDEHGAWDAALSDEDDLFFEQFTSRRKKSRRDKASARWRVEDGTLIFSGEGPMPDADWSIDEQEAIHPWDAEKNIIKAARIEHGVTSIGDNAFRCLPKLKKIEISDTVSQIGWCSLTGCGMLEEILVDPGNAAFLSRDGVLYSKDGEVLIHYPQNKADSVFTVPDGVVRVEHLGSTNLRRVVFPESVAVIAGGALCDCDHLDKLVLPPKLKSVESMLFWGNRFLTSVSLSSGTQFIEKDAFYQCPNLREINYDGTRAQWDEVAIDPQNNDLFSGQVLLRFADGSSTLLPRKWCDPFSSF